MSSEDASRESFEWYVEPEPYASTRAATATLRSRARRLHDERANSLGVVIITTLFFVLFASAAMVGGHAAIAPMLRSASAAREAGASTSDIVLPMPDGMFCRHMSFNNATADITDAGIQKCPTHIERGAATAPLRFEWGSGRP